MTKFCLLSVLLLTPLAGANELVSLKDGRSYVGVVTEVAVTEIAVQVEFPAPQTIRIAKDALTDRTLWRVLSARTAPGDGAAWFKLGGWADSRGLLVPALVAYRRAARDPKLAAEAKERVRSVEAKVARSLFDRGERYFVEGRPASAMRYFEILVARYGSTAEAPIAKVRLDQIRRHIRDAKAAKKAAAEDAKADKIARRARDQWDAEVDAIRRHLREAARARSVRFDVSRPVRSSRAAERVVRHLEAAWRRATDLGLPPEGVIDADRLTAEVKSRLVRAYLDAGLAYLMRPSLNQAEEFCTRACDLDPDNAGAHGLHEKIIYARLASSGWSGGFRDRGRR